MNKLKAFFTQNKALVTITSSVTLAVFLVFTVIAVAISDNGSKPTSGSTSTSKSDETTALVVDGTTEAPSQTVPEYSSEDETCGEEDESTEEVTTEPPVDPQTLPYMIKVNRAANCLTVYAKDDSGMFTVPVKAITVSCGKNVGDTPLGTYQTINEYKWRKMVDGTYSQYAYRIVGSILFHSVPYYTQAKNNLEWEEFNKLGSPASLGCVRMTVADAKWLMDNCPLGTLVTLYDDASNPGPLGKPETIKIPADSPYKNWDPTDPDPANPWKLFSATIEYPTAKTITVAPGSTTMDEIKATYFTAKDTCGNDISHKILAKGNYDLNVEGTYNLTFYVIDAIGSKAQVDITLIVKIEETTTPEPSTDNTSTEEPTTENPTTSDATTVPTTEETTTQKPSTEETTTQKPSEETTTQKPTQETTTEQTTTQETTTEETTTTQEPSSEEQSSEEQSSEEQSSEEQSSEEQSSEEENTDSEENQ